jgi:hypothetical protein
MCSSVRVRRDLERPSVTNLHARSEHRGTGTRSRLRSRFAASFDLGRGATTDRVLRVREVPHIGNPKDKTVNRSDVRTPADRPRRSWPLRFANVVEPRWAFPDTAPGEIGPVIRPRSVTPSPGHVADPHGSTGLPQGNSDPRLLRERGLPSASKRSGHNRRDDDDTVRGTRTYLHKSVTKSARSDSYHHDCLF